MTFSWSARRQLLYYAVGIVLATILLFTLWQTFLTSTPTCFDGRQNGDESGVDCGGSCAKLCVGEARAPNILWARAFEVAPQTYTAVSYVETRSAGNGARGVPYLFQLFDDKNELIIEREGVVDLPPVAVVPVVHPNINVGNRIVARTLFALTSEPVWERVSMLPQVRITEQQLSIDGTHLSAVIVNEGFEDVRNLRAAGVIFDTQGIARAASITLINRIPGKGSEPAVFTWSEPIQNVARAEITLLPSF
jgi:hypothetical protein